MRRYITKQDAADVGVDFGITAIQFLEQHVAVMRKRDIKIRVTRDTDNATTSQWEVVAVRDGSLVASVLLTVDVHGLAVLMGACNVDGVHDCLAAKWKVPSV